MLAPGAKSMQHAADGLPGQVSQTRDHDSIQRAAVLDATDRSMFARFVAAGAADKFVFPDDSELGPGPTTVQKLALQRLRREQNLAIMTGLDVMARASMCATPHRGQPSAVSTLPESAHPTRNQPSQHGTSGPMYSVQTLHLGTEPANRQLDLRTSTKSYVNWHWRAKHSPSSLLHLSLQSGSHKRKTSRPRSAEFLMKMQDII